MIYFHFLADDKLSFVRYAEVELAIKPWQSSSARNISVVQPFFTHCSCRSLYFFSLHWCVQSIFSSKETINSTTLTLFELTDQITRYGHWAVNVISAGKVRWYSKSTTTLQSVQSSNNELYLFGKVTPGMFLSGLKFIVFYIEFYWQLYNIPL